MADLQRASQIERDVEQAIAVLKKGAYLLKYGRRGKPKFCPFRLSTDESALIWYYGKEEKQVELRQVSRLIPGQRTSIFQRYPRPEKEYQSFSLIYNDRSLDLICKDKDEAEVWILGLKALIAPGSYRKVRNDGKNDYILSDSPRCRKVAPSSAFFDQGDGQQIDCNPKSRLGKAFADIIEYTATTKSIPQGESLSYSTASIPSGVVDNANGRNSAADSRVSLSSASSQGSGNEDFDSLGDVFLWGEGTGDGILGGGVVGICTSGTKMDAHLPKPLESTMVLDAYGLACGSRHAALVTKQGDIFSWGEESGGRLGHGVEADFSHPKLIDSLSGTNIEMVACGEYHTCAVTLSGDLYTWGDGTYNSGLLGHGSEVSHRIPKKVNGMDSIHVSCVSCGTWHTALTTSTGQLFTFGDGTFGALGHGDQKSTSIPREVDVLIGMKTLTVACGVWHTAAVVEMIAESSNSETSDGSSLTKLFTWGDGDKGRLGHGDQVSRLVPECVAALVDISFSKVSCGPNMTIALTNSGRVYTMGSAEFGQLGTPVANGKIPTCLEGKFGDSTVEEIACGSHHVAVLTSKNEVYTWGNGAYGQLGHGDKDDRHTPSLVDFLKDRQVKRLICGGNITAVICLHKWMSSVDNTMCFSCRTPFNFRRKRHNCYNCGLVFCNPCSSRKSMKASLAPSPNKPFRVCDDCFNKLQRTTEGGSVTRVPHTRSGNMLSKLSEFSEKDIGGSQFQGHTSRLSSADSEGRTSLNSPKADGIDRHFFSMFNGSAKRGNSFLSKQSTVQSGSPIKKFSISVPSSRAPSRATSPIHGKTSSPLSTRSATYASVRTSELIFDATKQRNGSLSQEVIHLRAQVEELAAKSRHLEGELEKKSMQLKEATALAADEAEKCKAAKEVVKSLTSKLKDMAERLPEGQSTRNNFDHDADDLNRSSNASSLTSQTSSKSESNGNSSNSALANGSKKSADKVVQDEPGVYVTLSPLPGGGNELKRVRFSRKRFTEQQAEKWWAENGDKVCERHNIVTAD